MKEKIIDLAQKEEEWIIESRRNVHQYPELGFEEFKTSRLITENLDHCGFKVCKDFAGLTAMLVLLEGDQSGRTRAFRADMDALPIQKITNLPFASKEQERIYT